MPMFAAFAYAVCWLFYYKKMHWKDFWRSNLPAIEKKQLKFTLQRFLVCALLLLGLVLLLYPDNFLNFPRQYPLFFMFFIVLHTSRACLGDTLSSRPLALTVVSGSTSVLEYPHSGIFVFSLICGFTVRGVRSFICLLRLICAVCGWFSEKSWFQHSTFNRLQIGVEYMLSPVDVDLCRA